MNFFHLKKCYNQWDLKEDEQTEINAQKFQPNEKKFDRRFLSKERCLLKKNKKERVFPV